MRRRNRLRFRRRTLTANGTGARVMIDREEVLHVARLARLKLREEEIEPLARELSAVLDHVARIGELDLEGVEPTTHVVEVTGAVARGRAARVADARGRALAGAGGERQRFLRTESAGVSSAELIELSAAHAARRIAAGELSAR